MCRNIRTLYNFEPPATGDEIWRSDGTESGTVELAVFPSSYALSFGRSVFHLTVYGGRPGQVARPDAQGG